ncbi:MAG: phage integrase N-terminal SAM-like domain-containing protein [Pyrinomonadaceae bacterium]|nr:phage integrase N-terminal SAM-like domain-containing protein [Pyrinomonadaceae bacterium]
MRRPWGSNAVPQPSQSRPDVRLTPPAAPQSQRFGEPRFLDQVAHACRVKHLAYRSEQSYVSWVKRFILFHNKRHPHDATGVPPVRTVIHRSNLNVDDASARWLHKKPTENP